jgi:hypothetical protein
MLAFATLHAPRATRHIRKKVEIEIPKMMNTIKSMTGN